MGKASVAKIEKRFSHHFSLPRPAEPDWDWPFHAALWKRITGVFLSANPIRPVPVLWSNCPISVAKVEAHQPTASLALGHSCANSHNADDGRALVTRFCFSWSKLPVASFAHIMRTNRVSGPAECRPGIITLFELARALQIGTRVAISRLPVIDPAK